MTVDDRPKLLYVARRHPGLAPDAFVPRWREHAALGMSQPRWRNVALYLHGDAITGLDGHAGVLAADGVAVVVYRSEAARQAHLADEAARRLMKADELQTFDAPVAQTSLLMQSQQLHPLHRDGPRLFVYWQATSPDFAAAWQAATDAVAPLRARAALGHVRNRVVARLGGLVCDGVDEYSAPAVEPLAELAGCLAAAKAGAAVPSLLLTRVVVLHDRPYTPAGE